MPCRVYEPYNEPPRYLPATDTDKQVRARGIRLAESQSGTNHEKTIQAREQQISQLKARIKREQKYLHTVASEIVRLSDGAFDSSIHEHITPYLGDN